MLVARMSQTVGLEIAAAIIIGGATLLTALAAYLAKRSSHVKRLR